MPSSEKIALDHSYCSKASYMNMSRENVAFCNPEVIPKVFNTKVFIAEDIFFRGISIEPRSSTGCID